MLRVTYRLLSTRLPNGLDWNQGRRMSVTLHIPDSIVSGLRLPEAEVEPRLRLELALALYGQGILSFGKASELAAIGRYQFADFLGERGIPRQYGAEELAEDLTYARGE